MLNATKTSTDLQDAKRIVLEAQLALDTAPPTLLREALSRHVADDYFWRGMHPFNEQHGAEAVATAFWQPMHHALTGFQRRMSVFFAGTAVTGPKAETWVAQMGHFMGLFDQPFLHIRPTRKLVLLRYAEFHRIEDGRIAESALFIDIPELMLQAGLQPFPTPTGVHISQPGPAPQTGLMFDARLPEEGAETLDLIEAMISDLGNWDLGLPLTEELARTWDPQMLWWGPVGIGATYTIPRYAEQHAGPFRASFADRDFKGHRARLAEGMYGGFFGWPNFTARPTGGFMGMPATDKSGPFRVVDIYRRDRDRLVENWIFIDLLHFWSEQGVDILGRTTGISESA
ncbi:MAG: ester cyclase [Pseudomonadota bacterium]